jgi:hypothetical protein
MRHRRCSARRYDSITPRRRNPVVVVVVEVSDEVRLVYVLLLESADPVVGDLVTGERDPEPMTLTQRGADKRMRGACCVVICCKTCCKIRCKTCCKCNGCPESSRKKRVSRLVSARSAVKRSRASITPTSVASRKMVCNPRGNWCLVATRKM